MSGPSATGSIPASAGEPDRQRAAGECGAVYPRECGGTAQASWCSASLRGLSPRVRGNLLKHGEYGAKLGSIPASAGEPRACHVEPKASRVYPRECGGTTIETTEAGWATGLSPRVRGNQHPAPAAVPDRGSIPASAGEPGVRALMSAKAGVYPRECGGTDGRRQCAAAVAGLSPRVRGNHAEGPEDGIAQGSIPASAGEPCGCVCVTCVHVVYPRECGGTQYCAAFVPGKPGLSPRVRGNLRRPQRRPCEGGSIPASAGEPGSQSFESHLLEVYPRECGGTASQSAASSSREGLSPRVRGNRIAFGADDLCKGSIPASAGEPAATCGADRSSTVYPRECGGTPMWRTGTAAIRGLSPRVRGNPESETQPIDCFGSIPASAGEPQGERMSAQGEGVYPRECGGTASRSVLTTSARGLSPRVRGNPARWPGWSTASRSIPASAGEPDYLHLLLLVLGVYPRECGGTRHVEASIETMYGLCSRVRGNH